MVDPVQLMFLQYTATLLTVGIAAWLYFVPWARSVGFERAVTPLLLLHTTRHLGTIYINPSVLASELPTGFTLPTAWGDVAAMLLAFIAIAAVVRGVAARPAVWLFNLVGFVDLCLAAYNAVVFEYATHYVGVAWFLPTLVVPVLIGTHLLIFWLLLRRAPETK